MLRNVFLCVLRVLSVSSVLKVRPSRGKTFNTEDTERAQRKPEEDDIFNPGFLEPEFIIILSAPAAADTRPERRARAPVWGSEGIALAP
jgi:hypothetical protein